MKKANQSASVPPEMQLAIQHHQAGRLQQAENIYKKLRNNPDATHMLGVIAYQQGKFDAAIECIRRALRGNPGEASYHYHLALAYRALQRLDDAAASYRRAIMLRPGYVDAHNNLGVVLKDQGQFAAAADSYRTVIALNPNYLEAHNNLGVALYEQGQLIDAEQCFRHVLASMPTHAEALNNLGNALSDQGLAAEGTRCFEHALALQPDYIEAMNNLAGTLRHQGRYDDAAARYRQALALRPDIAKLHFNLGNVLKDQEKFSLAAASYQTAITLDPDFYQAFNNLGVAFKEMRQLNKAADAYSSALRLAPGYAESHSNLGGILKGLSRYDEALASCETALKLDPTLADGYNNYGRVLNGIGRFDDAAASYQRALQLKPAYVEAMMNAGSNLKDQGRLDEALDRFRQALGLRPAFSEGHSTMLMSMQYASSVTREQLFDEHVRFADRFETPLKAHWLPSTNARDPAKRLKIGYLSPDFRQHAVAYFMEPILACHDKSQVEVTCYVNHPIQDKVSERLQNHADHWVLCYEFTDQQLIERIRADGIDILVDLAGHSGDNRMMALAGKPAPIQVGYLGYPGTTGLTAMDYRITDGYVEPAGLTEQFNVEQLWRLPDVFCCYRPNDRSPDPIDHPPMEDNGYITYGCFNNFSKVTDPVVLLWSRLLREVPTARLLLEIAGIDEPVHRSEVEQRLVRLGMPLERLILVARRAENQYVLYNRIDVALDPFPANGGTTSFDTLWMGVPLVTLAGQHFVARMGVTILSNAGMPELVAESDDEYVAIAAGLAHDPVRLHRLRDGLRERMRRSPLMDAELFTRNLEHAYRSMWQRWCASHAAS